MTCNATLPSDGKWYACARSSDRAMPDRKEWGDANSNEANVSDPRAAGSRLTASGRA